MKSSMIIVGAFIVGCIAGWLGWMPEGDSASRLSLWVLFALMFQVGMGIGSDSRLREILRTISPRMLLVPCATIVGTIAASAAVSLLLVRWSLPQVLAVGCGFGYYSLSSILIAQVKEPTVGVQVATELATIALLANIFREMMTLIFAPAISKHLGSKALISAAGVTSMDVLLPSIVRCSGKEMIPLAIVHGIIIDLSVPFFVSLFCSL